MAGKLPDAASFCVPVATLPNLYGQTSTMPSYSGYGYCPPRNALLFFGGGHAATPADAVHVFDLSTLAWSWDYAPTSPLSLMTAENWRPGNYWEVPGSVPPSRPVARHTYSGFLWSEATQRMVLMPGNNAVGNTPSIPYTGTGGGNRAHYEPIGKTWEIVPLAGVGGSSGCAFCVDPVSGYVIGMKNDTWKVYDPVNKRDIVTTGWAPNVKWLWSDGVYPSGQIGYTASLVYYPPTDRFYYIAREGPVTEITLDRSNGRPLFRRVAVPVTPARVSRPFTYDAKNQLIVGNIEQGKALGFKPIGEGKGEWFTHPAPGVGYNNSTWAIAYVEPLDAILFQASPATKINVGGVDVSSADNKARITWAFRWDPAQATAVPDPNLPKATITVGGQSVATMAAAALVGGDVTLGPGGVYAADAAANVNKPINVAGQATEVGKGTIGGKGIFVTNADARFENVVLLGAKVADGNGAAIRWQAGNVTLENVTLRNNENGLLGGDNAGTLIVNNCRVLNNGKGDGQTHGLYIGKCAEARITNSKFTQNYIGHHVKSRAAKTLIADCVLGEDFLGTESYNADFPNGGDVVMRNTVMRQGAKTDNMYMVSYFAEQRATHAVNALHIHDCTLESQGVSGTGIWNRHPEAVALIERVDFIGSFGTLVRGFHKLRDCKRNGQPIPDAEVLPEPTEDPAVIAELEAQIAAITKQLTDAVAAHSSELAARDEAHAAQVNALIVERDAARKILADHKASLSAVLGS